MRKNILRLAAISALAIAPSFADTMVGVELQLLIDVSASVTTAQYNLQRDGYAAAFLDATVLANIEGQEGGIAVQVVQWAGETQQKVVIDWTQLQTADDAKAFSALLAKMPRAFVGGLTAVQAAMLFGAPLFEDNGFDGKKLITDVSGDGACNDPKAGCGVGGQSAMKSAGVTVNGLVIGGDPVVEAYYASDVVTNGGIVFTAKDHSDFEAAITEKIRFETGGVPEPSTWAMIVTGLAGLMLSVRRRNA